MSPVMIVCITVVVVFIILALTLSTMNERKNQCKHEWEETDMEKMEFVKNRGYSSAYRVSGRRYYLKCKKCGDITKKDVL